MSNPDKQADELIAVCSSGDVANLQSLLARPSYEGAALCTRTIPYNLVSITVPILELMLQSSCHSGSPSAMQLVLDFSSNHNVDFATLVSRDTIIAAIETPFALEIFPILVSADAKVVQADLGHLGDPLSYAIHRKNIDLIKYLLHHGANPNARCAAHAGPGHHLRLAAKLSDVKIAQLLLDNGAQVAASGATHMAAQNGDVEMLKLLVKHGGDVNERLDVHVGFLGRPGSEEAKRRARETPLDLAVRNGHQDAEKWLISQEATSGL